MTSKNYNNLLFIYFIYYLLFILIFFSSILDAFHHIYINAKIFQGMENTYIHLHMCIHVYLDLEKKIKKNKKNKFIIYFILFYFFSFYFIFFSSVLDTFHHMYVSAKIFQGMENTPIHLHTCIHVYRDLEKKKKMTYKKNK